MHRVIYHTKLPLPGRKLVINAEKMYNTLKAPRMRKQCGSSIVRCGLCGVTGNSTRNPSEKSTIPEEKHDFADDFNKMVLRNLSIFTNMLDIRLSKEDPASLLNGISYCINIVGKRMAEILS